jgi:hypothetical protein
MFNKLTEKLTTIADLPDKPLEGPGAVESTQALKEKFDDDANTVRLFVNNLIEALAAGTAAANIGAKVTNGGQTTNTTLQALLNTLGEAVSVEYSGTLAADGWTGAEAPYRQAVTIIGILSTDSPIIDLVPDDDDYATAEAEDAAWGSIYRAVTSANTITFYAKEAPTVALTFKARCIRK